MCTWRRPGYELLPVLVLLCGIATSSTFLRCPYWSTKTHRFSGVGRASLSGLEDRHSFLISTACSSRRSKALSRLSNVCAPQVRIFERDQDGARGCYTSHLSVYKEALQKGLSWAMILEDNLMLTQEPLEVQNSLAGLLEWLSTSPARGTQWSIVHLSLVHSAASLRLRSPQDLPYGQLVKVERTAPDWYGPVQIKRLPGLGTTAYLVSRDAMQAILDYDSRRGYVAPIDDVLADMFPESTYAVFPAPLHRGRSASLINPDQELFRSIMYEKSVFKNIENALVWTGLSSSELVWVFLASMTAWTFGVTLPVLTQLLK